MTTLANAIREAAARLPGDEARLEAELLLAHALERPRSWFYAHSGDVLDGSQARAFDALLRRREGGEPVAQITGHRGFWSLELAVTADTLIPRPETELLVELALERLPPAEMGQVLDLGTGTGAIALAIASERPLVDVSAVDVSDAALAVARANADEAGLPLRLLQGDWFEPVAGDVYRMIVSNPPYIADDDPHLRQGDLRYEPRSALASGPESPVLQTQPFWPADGISASKRHVSVSGLVAPSETSVTSPTPQTSSINRGRHSRIKCRFSRGHTQHRAAPLA